MKPWHADEGRAGQHYDQFRDGPLYRFARYASAVAIGTAEEIEAGTKCMDKHMVIDDFVRAIGMVYRRKLHPDRIGELNIAGVVIPELGEVRSKGHRYDQAMKFIENVALQLRTPHGHSEGNRTSTRACEDLTVLSEEYMTQNAAAATLALIERRRAEAERTPAAMEAILP